MFDFPAIAQPAPKPFKPYDWNTPVHYDEDRKRSFHRAATRRLKALAKACGWDKATFDLRSNKAGIAVSGEIVLHHDAVYISVSQSRMGSETGILIRTCKSRKDYVGGTNNFAPLRLLDDTAALARRVQQVNASRR